MSPFIYPVSNTAELKTTFLELAEQFGREQRGKLQQMAQAWIEWGKKNGYRW